jgi:hypothetical protein
MGEDEAEKIFSSQIDKRENYTIGVGAYKRDREIIVALTRQIFGKKLNFEEEILPKTISSEKAKGIKSFFFVNNNIVLLGFFSYCLQEKIFIDLIIKKFENDQLEKKFKEVLENFYEEITSKINSLKREENQFIYSMVWDFNETFNNTVLKIILPKIIEDIKKNDSLKKKFEEGKLEKYEKGSHMFGLAHVLLAKVIPDRKERKEKILEKYPKENPIMGNL